MYKCNTCKPVSYVHSNCIIHIYKHTYNIHTYADRLVGQVLGLKDQLPDVYTEVEISYYLLRRLLGVKTTEGTKQAKVSKLTKGKRIECIITCVRRMIGI